MRARKGSLDTATQMSLRATEASQTFKYVSSARILNLNESLKLCGSFVAEIPRCFGFSFGVSRD